MIVVIRGGGDLASGVALRLHRAGLRVAICELPRPLAVRRLVSFASAIYSGETTIEGITARRIKDPEDTLSLLQAFSRGQIPVLVDPEGRSIQSLHPAVVVDGRMTKKTAQLIPTPVNLIIGLGPGFTAGENCHAVIETNRGHMLGRVLWEGSAEADSGLPETVDARRAERVLRAPADGEFQAHVEIGSLVKQGDLIAEVGGMPVTAAFDGALRGLLYPGLHVAAGIKIGDLDPRKDPHLCSLVSDKALAMGGSVLEAILSRSELRSQLWS
jgi:xanthine dehydrogenase accessory factor